MTLEQLVGKYMRLRTELSQAYEAPVWDTSHLDRLSDEIAATEMAMIKARLRVSRPAIPCLASSCSRCCKVKSMAIASSCPSDGSAWPASPGSGT